MTDKAEVERELLRIVEDMGKGDGEVPISGWDSMDKVRLFLAVEERFAIRLGLKEIRGIGNLADLITLVRSKI